MVSLQFNNGKRNFQGNGASLPKESHSQAPGYG